MQLSENTIAILNSYASINRSLMMKKGNVIKTKPEISHSPSVKSIVKEEFPVDFAFYDFKKFLQILSLYEKPDLSFKEDHVIITDAENSKKKSTLYYDNPKYVTDPDYESDFKLPSTEEEFEFTYDSLIQVVRSSKIIGTEEIAFIGDGENISISTFSKQKSANSFSIEVGKTNRNFTMIFTVTDFQFIKVAKFKASLCFKGIARFTSQPDEAITYWIAASTKSKY